MQLRASPNARNNARHRHAELVVNLVGHLVAIDDLPAGGVADDDDRLEVREDVLARDPAQDLVEEIERSDGGIVRTAA